MSVPGARVCWWCTGPLAAEQDLGLDVRLEGPARAVGLWGLQCSCRGRRGQTSPGPLGSLDNLGPLTSSSWSSKPAGGMGCGAYFGRGFLL